MSERKTDAGDLRRRAEERLKAARLDRVTLRPGDAERLLHELRVHQIELELQNEELRASRLETEALLGRYTELFEFAPIGFFHVADDGTIRESNFAGARLLGSTRGALVGRVLASLVAERERRAFERLLSAVLTADETASETGEFVLFPPNGGELRVRVTGAALGGGQAPSALLAVEDVTARRQAQDALRDEARRKDDFLAALSHELRNPLAPIRNALTLLERLPGGSERAPAALAIIDRQVTHLTRVIDDLLDVTRIARGKVRLHLERLDLADLVRHTAEDHRPLFEARGVQLRCQIQDGPSWVDGDASRLVQVLGNLLGNALKFTNPGGTVEVVLARRDGGASLRVRDTGMGIAPEVATRLFEPFSQGPQTLERSRGGLGLGLATVKGLVELHRGTVEVASAGPGRGAEFIVRLPLAEAPAQPAGGGAAAEVRPHRVLVIEDNADAAQSLKDLLELEGHEVRTAADGPSGLLAARAFQPSVVICDIGLPGMSGYEVARALRSESPSTAAWLVALSGYAQPDDARRAEESGFDCHLAKPASPADLRRVLARASAG